MRNAYVQMCDYHSRFRILKGGKISLVVSALIASVTLLQASPNGGVVTAGSASIAQSGSVTNIVQTTNKASINWNNFSIASHETVNFKQPNAASITLNRVVGNEKSIIAGALNANGQVFILNSNGVLFSKNASINTAGLVATTMNLSDADFMNGNYAFKGDSTASIINQGAITISDKGYAVLFGQEVRNEGIIKATLGKVELVGAKEVTLNLNGNSLVNLKVDKGVLDALVENKGAVYADGGEVYLTTNAVGELLRGVVNNQGIIEANSLDDITGKIELFSHGGTTTVEGTLEAKEGFIETSGDGLHVKTGTTIKAKEWLLDPTTITIENGGGADILASTMDADTITTVLDGGTNVTLSATSDITVNEAIIWSAATQLKLTSSDTIHVNDIIKNTNTTNGGVYFQAANTANKVIFGANGKVIIYNPYQLQWISQALQGKYELGGNINASGTSSWNSNTGFIPIGDASNQFTGILDGKDYVIDGLYIYKNINYMGFFSYTHGATIKNLGLVNASLRSSTYTGHSYMGGLVGYMDGGFISDAYVEGSINVGKSWSDGTYHAYAGGLVGYVNGGSLTNAYSTVSVNAIAADGNYYSPVNAGNAYVGGLAGYMSNGVMINVYANSFVTGYGGEGGNPYLMGGLGSNGGKGGDAYVGGLVGYMSNSSIANAYAIGGTTILGTAGNGGKGSNGGTMNMGSYTTNYPGGNGGNGGSAYMGGLVGYLSNGSISNAYATKSISGNAGSGGSGGYEGGGSSHQSSSGSAGSVFKGGVAGGNSGGTLNGVFWDRETSGMSTGVGTGTSTGVIGKTTAEMQTYSTYHDAGWNIIGVDGAYPTLTFGVGGNTAYTWQIGTFLTYTLSSIASGYTYTGTDVSLSSLWSASDIFGASYASWVFGTDYVFKDSGGNVVTGYANAGTYSGLYIDVLKSGYTEAISGNTTGSLTIAKANATVTANSDTKTYNGLSQSITGYTVSGLVNGENASVLDTVAISGSGTNAGTYSVTGMASDNNYNLSVVDGTLTIAKANATVTANSDTKTYNGVRQFVTGGYSVSGLLNGENASVLDTITGASASGTHAGTYTTTLSGSDNNYNLSFVNGTLSIAKANITVSTSNVTKTYDGTTSVAGSAIVTSGTLYDSLSGGIFAYSDPNAGTGKSVTVSGVSINDGNGGNNYNVSYANNTSSSITKAPLIITAKDASKPFDGIAYNGGNGVSFSGFVNHDTSANVGGTLSYGGNSQGALNEGSYTISVSGLHAMNYVISYLNGTLTITEAIQPSPIPISLGRPNVTHIVNGTAVRLRAIETLDVPQNAASQSSIDTPIESLGRTLIYRENEGIRLPDDIEPEFLITQR